MATGSSRTWTAAIVAKGQVVGSSGWVLAVGYYRAVGDDNLGEGKALRGVPPAQGDWDACWVCGWGACMK